MADLELSSPAFDDGQRIPEKYGYAAENVHPPLEIADVPDAADSLALVGTISARRAGAGRTRRTASTPTGSCCTRLTPR